MSRVKVSTVIDARPAEVWWAIEDIASHVDWMLDAQSIRFTSAQRSGVGTTFECVTGVGPLRFTDRMEITEWVPGRTMGVVHSGLVTGTGRFTLKRARRGRTRFRWEEELELPRKLGGRVGAVVAKPVLTAVWKRNLRNLKAKVETSRSSRSGDQ